MSTFSTILTFLMTKERTNTYLLYIYFSLIRSVSSGWINSSSRIYSLFSNIISHLLIRRGKIYLLFRWIKIFIFLQRIQNIVKRVYMPNILHHIFIIYQSNSISLLFYNISMLFYHRSLLFDIDTILMMIRADRI